MLAGAVAFAGCGGGSGSSTPTAAGVTGTGVAGLDQVIAIVERRDAAAFMQLVTFVPLACTTDMGTVGPPKCATGEAVGTLASVFNYTSCELDWRTSETIGPAITDLMATQPKLYAAFKPAAAYPWVGGDYVAVFQGPDPRTNGAGTRGAAVAVSNGRVVGLWLQCGAGGGIDGMIPAGQKAFLVTPPH
ncbi:MAG: hypothetical protein ACRDG3_07875 [Tepidiformaceae bacterium]